jgi:hypothetical protein
MGYLTINTRSNRVVIISSVITRILLTLCNTGTVTFQPFNKDTHDYSYLCMCQLIVFIIYYCCLLFIVVVHLFCSLFDLHLFFVRHLFFQFFAFHLFVVHCSKEKDSILILDCIPGISIPLYVKCCTRITSPSMQVNKHHTSDCTDLVLV